MKHMVRLVVALVLLVVVSIAQQPAAPGYGEIDGKHLKEYVEDLTAISRRYRDQGHRQWWGRISGTEADAENAQWLLDKFRKIGLSEVHQQFLDLPPQWRPLSWAVTASAGGKTLNLDTAQPTSTSPGTPAEGLDLEAVDVALGAEGDLAGRDLRGKAVFFYSADLASRHAQISEGAIKRIGEKGAAAIFIILGIPGNLRTQFYPVGSTVPTFSLGQQDGAAVRDLIGKARGGEPPRVKIELDVKTAPNLKTSTVWGSLPGATDETVIVVAHRDGWFEGAVDNASGVATMLGIAEYFAKIPKQQRRRTIYFLGTSGHHDNAAMTGHWLADHKDLFAKTALAINCEHTSAEQLVITRAGTIKRTNATVPLRWYVGGSPQLSSIAVKSFESFGIAIHTEPEAAAGGEMGPFYQLAPSLQLIEGNLHWHSDEEGDDDVPQAGLAATTRAYAKIIAEVNQLNLKDLARPGAGTPK